MANPDWLRAAIALGNQFHHRRQRPLLHNAINLGTLALFLSLIAGILAAARSLPLWLYIPAGGFLLGVAFFSLIILVVHEASHGMFLISDDRSRARSWNRAFGWVVSLPFGIHYEKHWEEGHHTHHLRPLEPDDPQHDQNGLTGPALVRMVVKMLFIPAYVLYWNPSRKYATRRWRAPANGAFWLLSGGAAWKSCGWAAVAAIVVGFNVLGALNQLKTAMEHGGEIGSEENRYLRSRTSLFPLRWLLMPLNISLHFEHHLNYCVPWYRLPAYHRAVRELVPAPLQPEVFNVRVWDQVMGRIGRLPDPVRPYLTAQPGVVEGGAFDAAD